ncbi:protein SIEVE ELEMENT OCCLUSION B-like [Neltuma alba]|uniref:protein SIEVE ELEMENT OCCLUSION B-like n=1 Tax=Neltuma alba TaxID=207710 RepID=UPI0010A2D56D|nr:protein SIEVE ELEMENT OCCLUSION B-like [Prosopis alba]
MASSSTPVRRMMKSDSNVKPLTLDDNQVLGLVHDCYVVNEHGETFDSEALFSVVSDVIIRSLRTCDPSIKYHPLTEVDKTSLSNLEPPIYLLKDFACQMRKTKWHAHHTNEHETTMSILRTLDSYSWCAKAVTALAAFALEYGIFWHLYDQKILYQGQDSIGNSLAVLSSVHAVDPSDLSHYNLVVKHVSETVDYIVALEKMSKQGYDVRDIRTLEEAIQNFPVFVYWIVLTIVSLAAHMDILLGYTSSYKLSDIGNKISKISDMLSRYLAQIKREIEFIKEYQFRYRIVFQTPREILQVLKYLLFPRDVNDPHVYDGYTGSMVSFKVFRQKHVVLFLSGLYSIGDEIRLLKSIQEGLKKDPKVIKGFRKEDFKILWVPIVDDDDQVGDNTKKRKQLFEDLKRQMEWYVVDYSIIPAVCKNLVRDRFKYQNKPMIPVFNPQGDVTNDNASHMLFSWDIQAFPWGINDDEHLITKWNWFWSQMKGLSQEIETGRKAEAYIVIYGRTDVDYCDNQWLLRIPAELEKVKRDEITKRSDVVITYYHHGKEEDDLKIVNGFWANVENLFYSMTRKKTKDPSFEDVRNFLGLRQEQTGWVLVSKGENVKLLCRGDTFYQTLKEFDAWKLNIEKDPGFDVSFNRHYRNVLSKLPPPANCLRLDVKNHAGDISSPIYCMCGRPMNIKLVRYVCCHEYKEEPVNARASDVKGS